jgi:hypothetical protein
MASRKGDAHGPISSLNGLTRRQELFAEYLVAGHSLEECVTLAGYKEEVGHMTPLEKQRRLSARGTKMVKNGRVQKFIQELRAQQLEKNLKEKAHLSDKYAMNIEKLTLMLLEDRHFARTGELQLPNQEGPIRNPAERPTDGRFDARAAVQATMGLAKLHGLLIDKAEVTVQGSISRMSNEELLQFISTVHREIGPILEVGDNLDDNPQVEYLPPAMPPVRKG